MFVSRQGLVFRIEKKYPDGSFPGGSNASIIHEYDNKDFVNPVPDYISSIRLMSAFNIESFEYFLKCYAH